MKFTASKIPPPLNYCSPNGVTGWNKKFEILKKYYPLGVSRMTGVQEGAK